MKHAVHTTEDLEKMVDDFPSALVVAVYDEAIASLNAAADSARAGEIEARCNATTRAAEMIGHLGTSLDVDKGGIIAMNLGELYKFVLSHIPMINVRNDAGLAEELAGLLTPLRDSWVELDTRIRDELRQAEAVAPLPENTAGMESAMQERVYAF